MKDAHLILNVTETFGKFPNYEHAYYSINSYDFLWASPTTAEEMEDLIVELLDTLRVTPVIIRDSLFASLNFLDYSGQALEHDTASGLHVVVVVDSGYASGAYGNSDSLYLECMSSYVYGCYDDGYYKVLIKDIHEWCTRALFPIIHTSNDYSELDYDHSAKIFPRLIPEFKDDYLQEEDFRDDSEQIYIYGDAVVPSGEYPEIPPNKTVYVEPDQWGDNATGAPYSSLSDIVISDGATLTLGDGVKITRRGDTGYWGAIVIQTGVTGGNITFSNSNSNTIEYATKGLYIREDIDIDPEETLIIQNCYKNGIYIYNKPPEISNVKLVGMGGYGNNDYAIQVNGGLSDPTIDKVSIDSEYGFYLAQSADATFTNSDIDSDQIASENIKVGAYATLDIFHGNNNIYRREDKYAINNDSTAYFIVATLNYWGWGLGEVTDDFFSHPNSIAYTPYDTSPNSNGAPSKITVSEVDIVMNNFRRGTELEKSGDWNGALNKYKSILSIAELPQWRRKAIKRIIKVCNRSNLDFTDVKDIISSELVNARSAYKASLDFLLCNISVKEALREENPENRSSKIFDSIDGFSGIAQKYSGTTMEVEILSYIATLYGDHLHDKIKAKECADKAASINPGQACLFDAYASAGVEYSPGLYTDKFHNTFEDFGDPPEKPALGVGNYVSVYPNPSNPRTTISYSIRNPSHVKLVIYSITGQKVATLVDKHMRAGSHSVIFDGSDYGSGVYIYKFDSKGFTKTGKMLLLK